MVASRVTGASGGGSIWGRIALAPTPRPAPVKVAKPVWSPPVQVWPAIAPVPEIWPDGSHRYPKFWPTPPKQLVTAYVQAFRRQPKTDVEVWNFAGYW